MAYLSDFERQESEKHIHVQASSRKANWAEPPCNIVQIILAEECFSFSSDYRNYIKVVKV